jgi:hypothetical protein
MEGADYNAFADMLAKFHTSSEGVKALWLLVMALTAVGVSACMAWAATEIVRALAGRRRGAAPVEFLVSGEDGWRLVRHEGEIRMMRLAGPVDALPAPPARESGEDE